MYYLVHLSDELVNVLLPVTVVTAFNVVLELASTPTTSGIAEFERPKEIRCLLEIRARSENFVHEILDTQNIIFAECRLDDAVVRKRNTLLIHLAIASLVD